MSDDKLGERFILVRSPHTFGELSAPTLLFLAVIGGDGIAQILRPVQPGKDEANLLAWMQPDCDGIKSGQLNWQKERQRELMDGPGKAEAERQRAEAAKQRKAPGKGGMFD